MQNILKSSVFFRWLTAFFSTIGIAWHKSAIVTWFLSPREIPAESSAFGRLCRLPHRLLSAIFSKLGLTKLFKGSIFKQPFLWCLLPAVLAPLLPTMLALCLVLIAFFSLLVRFGTEKERRLYSSPVNKYIGLFALVYLIATLTSVSRAGSLLTGFLIVFFTLFALMLNNAIDSKRQTDFLIRLLVLAGTAISAYGVYQYFFYDATSAGAWIDSDMFSDITNRVYATLGNPNVLAEYLLLVTPFAFACVLTAKTMPRRLFYLLCLFGMLLCMLFTSSRGGWLGLIFAAAVFAVMMDARFILLGAVALVVMYFALPDWVVQRFTSIGNMTDSSTSYRVYIWLGTLAMLKDYWFAGIGPGPDAFNAVYPAYSFNTVSAAHSHNLFLQLTSDAGILGLLLFVFMLFSFYRRTLSAYSLTRQNGRRKGDRQTRIYLAAAVSAVSGFLLQGMTDFSFYNARVTLTFWAVIAVGLALTRRSSMEEGHYLWSES
jgi:putative inorganic carbon (HCO3(-)) transporter